MISKMIPMMMALALCLPMVSQAAVLANIGEKTINDEQLRKDYSSVSGEQRDAINKDVATRRNLVDNAINAELLVQAAKKAGLDKDDDYKEAVDRFQRQYLASKFMQKAVEPKLVKGEVKKFYEQNKTFFDSSQVCALHVVMQDQQEAEKVAKLAKQKGTKFEDLAVKHSLDPTAQDNKGNLGCFTRDRMVPEFAAAAFDMRKGEIRGPVRTIYGYHVIKVYDIKAGKVPGYDEVEQQAKETYRLKLVNELLSELRTKSNVKVNEEELKKFKL